MQKTGIIMKVWKRLYNLVSNTATFYLLKQLLIK